MRYTKPSCKEIPNTVSPNHIVFSVYNKLMASAKYFNHLQIRNANLALFFFLAAFFAIGVILDTVNQVPIYRFLVILSISVTSLIAIIFFWVMDVFFYNKYLETTVDELAEFEKKHPWLPQVHRRMKFILGGTTVFQKSVIYISFILILFIFVVVDLYVIKNSL